jgi:alpha-L-rhamnosidase
MSTLKGEAVQARIKVEALYCEYLKNPMGIDAVSPRLSWKMSSASKDQVQSAYELLAASSRDLLQQGKADLWRTGKVDSDQSQGIIYAGKELASKDACYWKVRVWDREGAPSEWSEVGHWTMGILREEDWEEASWIGSPEIYEQAEQDVVPLSHWIWHPDVQEPDRHVFFRREIQLDTSILCLKLDITAFHRYVLWVNGRVMGEVNRNWNTPTIAHYQLYLNRNLVPGKNVIAIRASSREGRGALICGMELLDRRPNVSGLLDPLGWKCSDRQEQHWQEVDFQAQGWEDAVSVGGYGEPPFGEVDRNPAMASPLLRKEIEIRGPVKKAVVYMSGLGFSELYVNGVKADDRVMDPEFTDYTRRVPYVAKDITPFLYKGTNVLGVILGGAYYKESTADMFDFQDAPWSDQPKLLLQVVVEYPDGTCQVICSDSTWKSATGEILFNSLRGGETIDHRKARDGWMYPGWDVYGWKDAVLLEAPLGRLVAQQTLPARVMEKIRPVSLSEPAEGLYLFDMGVNMTGWSAFRVQGQAGQTIIMDYNERLYPDGTLDINHEATHTYGRYQMDKLILDGEGTEVFEPRFTQHSFRYVQATGLSHEPVLEDLQGKWVHTDIGHAGSFECSSEKLNRIQQAIVRGYKNYILHHPLDPLREKMGWTQDVWNMFEAGAYNFEVGLVYRKWFNDFLDAQDPNGHVPPVIPANDWGRTTAGGAPGNMSDPWWGGALVYGPWFLYQYYGDLSALQRGYAAMKRYVDYIGSTSREYIVDWTLGDWGDVSHMERGGQYRLTPVEESSTCAFYYLATLVQQAALLLGESGDAEKYGDLALKIRDSFHERFFEEAEGVYRTRSQSAQILPLYLGMVPKEKEDGVLEWVVNDIKEHDNHLTTGFVGILPLLDELSRRGRTNVALTLAMQESYPSWHHMLKDGGTTITEYWNPDRGSKNIVNLGGPLGAWFYKYLAGIRPLQPAFREFTLQPYFSEELQWMKATFDSPYGKIESSWERSPEGVSYRVRIPVNACGRVTLPVGDPATVSVNGKRLGAGDFSLGADGQAISFSLRSGEYAISF